MSAHLAVTGHTPLPWTVQSNDPYGDVYVYGRGRKQGRHKQLVAQVWSGVDRSTEVATANADFIVLACNAHDELVAALRGLNETTERYIAAPSIDHMNALTEGLRFARAALAKVQP
jgi:hypothetical protein